MTNVVFLVASIGLLGASGLAVWLWFALTTMTDELRAFDGVQGLRLRL